MQVAPPAFPRTLIEMKSKLSRIIEEATVDCYNDDEVYSGWACTLTDAITSPQECFANGHPATLLKMDVGKNSRAVYALVKIDKKRVIVPAETLELRDKKQDAYIQAYKKWLAGDY